MPPIPQPVRRALRTIIVPTVLLYTLQLTAPSEDHFKRYMRERSIFEPAFKQRVQDPTYRYEFHPGFFYATAEASVGTPGGTSAHSWSYFGVLGGMFRETQLG
jgi:hypothetical protein